MDNSIKFEELVSTELTKRGRAFSIEEASGCYVIQHEQGTNTICLDNLRKELLLNGDVTRIQRFFDSIEASWKINDLPLDASKLFWSLEPNDYFEKPFIFDTLSGQVDQALVHFCDSVGLITFVTPEMLAKAELTQAQASAAALDNLDRVLKESTLECDDVAGTKLGMVSTKFPFKTALLLAPSLQAFVEPQLGWPVLAVAPDRNFLYLWSAEDRDFMTKVGTVVLNEYAKAPYPVSTEVFEIDDDGIGAIGAYSRQS